MDGKLTGKEKVEEKKLRIGWKERRRRTRRLKRSLETAERKVDAGMRGLRKTRLLRRGLSVNARESESLEGKKWFEGLVARRRDGAGAWKT